jgi:hypothetical protein
MTAGLLARSRLVGEPGRHSDRHGIDRNLTSDQCLTCWKRAAA